MAVNMPWEAVTGTWPNPTQYLQEIIDGQGAGTTFNLKSGIHRGQQLTFKAGDTLVMESGAVLSGAEDLGNTGWTVEGAYWFKNNITRGETSNQTTHCRSGYECDELNVIIIDGLIRAWKTTKGGVNEWSAYYDSGNNRVYIGTNPSGKTIEIARQPKAILGDVNDVTIKADNAAQGGGSAPATFQGEIYGYASDVQHKEAAVAGGRNISTGLPSGTGWVFQDLFIHSNAGSNIAPSDAGTIRRCKITDGGNMGIPCDADDVVIEYSQVGDNNTGGWSAGWEGGNTKLKGVGAGTGGENPSRGKRYILRGNDFYISTANPNIDINGVLWFDVSADGNLIYGNTLYDTIDHTSRGLFYEITYSGKIYRNVMHGLSRATNNFWGRGIVLSSSGPGVPDTATIYPDIEVYENIVYKCGGGIGGVENSDRGSDHYGLRYVHKNNHHHNIVYYDPDFTDHIEQSGIRWKLTAGTEPTDCLFDYNVYFTETAAGTANFIYQTDVGTSDSTLTWAQWQSYNNNDANGVLVEQTTHPATDPDPWNGGCM